MSIIVSKGGKNAQKLERKVIQQEDYLQRYIYANPDSLPLHEFRDDLRLLILAREFPTASGPIDALGVDDKGDIYVIETKLYKNPDKRLVIAQMLDYGAALWNTYADPDQFIDRIEENLAKDLGAGLVPKLQEAFGFDPEAAVQCRDMMKENLSSARFRFVVLMDRLDERLKELISFMNVNSQFDIFGVELDFYEHQDLEIIIPRLYGAERKKEVSGSSRSESRRTWNALLTWHCSKRSARFRTAYRDVSSIAWHTQQENRAQCRSSLL